jgi:diaminohydroxyphosphoribosylaminopyrimidine deaminase/5-amino-6-(5-phosphoribosylamino)uracil reductase
VSLEPCSHHGRTPPCVDALIEAGIARVVAAMQDPNSKVAGGGFAALRAAGIQVESGLMQDEARALNIGFVARMSRGRPWVRMKIAASLDGRTALANGRSQWITGPEARRDGHAWRARACAVLTGIGTVRDDDPQLNVREVETTRQPLKVVVDSRLQLPLSAKLLQSGPVLVAAAVEDKAAIAALRDKGAEVVVLPNARGKVELTQLMRELARRELNEVHVEAGYKLNGSLLAAGLVDELLVYLAPSILGDGACGMFSLPELTDLAHKRLVQFAGVQTIGSDLRVLARVVN